MDDLNRDGHPTDWADDISMPALLRAAWRGYGSQVRQALAAEGYGDLPKNGPFVIGAIANENLRLDDADPRAEDTALGLAHRLGITRNGVAQLLDTLILRGYVERRPSAQDSRHTMIDLTERGIAVATVVAESNSRSDDAVADVLGEEGLRLLRRQLAAVIHVQSHRSGDGDPPSSRS